MLRMIHIWLWCTYSTYNHMSSQQYAEPELWKFIAWNISNGLKSYNIKITHEKQKQQQQQQQLQQQNKSKNEIWNHKCKCSTLNAKQMSCHRRGGGGWHEIELKLFERTAIMRAHYLRDRTTKWQNVYRCALAIIDIWVTVFFLFIYLSLLRTPSDKYLCDVCVYNG